MSNPPSNDDHASTVEELTAYLDGELDAPAALRVEQRLGSDAQYRELMQSLQRTWDLLDELPTEDVEVSFTKTTMEMIVDESLKQTYKSRIHWWVWPTRLLILLGLPLLIAGISFWTTRSIQLEPERQLLENLSLIDNFDRYEKVDKDIGFLARLDKQGMFADTSNFYASGNTALAPDFFLTPEDDQSLSPETIEDRRDRIESLDVEQKTELLRKFDEFTELPHVRKETLGSFHHELTSHPDRHRLTKVMSSYYDWLKTLGLTEQATLLDMPTGKRLVEIARIKTQQARDAFGKEGATRLPTERDARFLFDWYRVAIHTNEKTIRSQFPRIVSQFYQQNKQPINLPLLRQYATRQPLHQLVAILFRVNQSSVEEIILQNVEFLRQGLSDEARSIFDRQSTVGQHKLVLSWLEAVSRSRAVIPPEVLQRFYEQLSVEERDELDKMSPENWIKTLTEKYRQYQTRRFSPVRHPGNTDWESILNNSTGF